MHLFLILMMEGYSGDLLALSLAVRQLRRISVLVAAYAATATYVLALGVLPNRE
jgi:hypothetical protein